MTDLAFDFERNFDDGPVAAAGRGAAAGPGPGGGLPPHGSGGYMQPPPGQSKRFRSTVCRHWLRGLCMKGDQCGFLHEFDPSRMPVCRFFAQTGECRETDCKFKHSNEDIKDCNMYKLGFCIHGPNCRYRHLKLPREALPSPEEAVRRREKDRNFLEYGPDRHEFRGGARGGGGPYGRPGGGGRPVGGGGGGPMGGGGGRMGGGMAGGGGGGRGGMGAPPRPPPSGPPGGPVGDGLPGGGPRPVAGPLPGGGWGILPAGAPPYDPSRGGGLGGPP